MGASTRRLGGIVSDETRARLDTNHRPDAASGVICVAPRSDRTNGRCALQHVRMSGSRLVSKPFVAVTAATGAFFVYVGMLVPLLPRFIEDELGAGELGVGLSMSTFAFAAIFARPVIGRLVSRYGRRRVMIAGSLLAGCRRVPVRHRRLAPAAAGVPRPRRHRRGRRCSSARRRSSPTSRRPNDGPRQRATSPSPCSAASASVRSSARRCCRATASTWRSSSPPGSPCSRPSLSLAVPHFVPPATDDGALEAIPARARSATVHPPGRTRARPRAGVGHRRVLGVLGVPARPRRARSASPAPAGCSPPTASCASCCASSAPACPSVSAPAAP